MAKSKISNVSRAAHEKATAVSLPFVAAAEVVDPALASLFQASTVPVDPQGQTLTALRSNARAKQDSVPLLESEHEIENPLRLIDVVRESHDVELGVEHDPTRDHSRYAEPVPGTPGGAKRRKRKRDDVDDNLEDTYMRRQERDEVKQDQRRQLRRAGHQITSAITGYGAGVDPASENGSLGNEDGKKSSERGAVRDVRGEQCVNDYSGDHDEATGRIRSMSSQASGGYDINIQHESLAPSRESQEFEKSSRTVFLANVSTVAITTKSAKKALMKHLTSFISSLPADSVEHKLESLRFRSVAFTSSAVPKKAAFAKKELMDATTKSTNAYVVYSTTLAAREAVKKLNGTVILDRHLRVDSVAHPAKTDHRRCVFVGNLGFVDDESLINASEEINGDKKPRKVKEASDIEEGLWRQFENAGRVESVRVIRDQQTRVGKGIAYVQFVDPNGVEAALLFNEKKYPPLLPRKLRVVRAKSIKKPSTISNTNDSKHTYPKDNSTQIYNPKVNLQVRSFQGRAGKLLGRAGAAQYKALGTPNAGNERESRKLIRSPESIVFEGYRASSKDGKGRVKMGGSGKRKGKPRSRSSKRGSAWKKSGGKRVR
ncbi:MAG: Nucleolar protein 12 [Candelina submexicana]|nr:MAG: Nucleolar protein 12 [Candelina submexicana]